MVVSVLDVVTRLSKGLNTIDIKHVTNLVENFGLYGAARILGYDVSHYNNLLMSGRLAIENLRNNSPKTLLEYADKMKNSLNTQTYDFIQKHHKELQVAIDANSDNDYDHDWFSANTMITTYSAILAHGTDGIETPQYIWMRIAIQLYCDSSNPVWDVIRAYQEMSVGWYTPASPTIFNAGMKEPQMASCFVEGTEVCTTNGVKCIENVCIGDKVITHTGSVKEVLQIHQNKLGDRNLYDVTCWKTPNIIVTGNHRVMAIKNGESPSWTSVDELTTNHYIAIPARKEQKPTLSDLAALTFDISGYLEEFQRGDHVEYEYEITNKLIHTTSATTNTNASGLCTIRHKHKPINRYFTVDNDVAKAIGMWFGDGCIRNRKDRKVGKKHICGLNIVAHENNKSLIDFWISAMKKFVGVEPSFYHQSNLVYAEIHSPVVGEVFSKLFGKGFAGKHLHPTMFKWSSELIKSFMIGLMSTDGCLTKQGTMIITLANTKLVKEIYHLCRQIGEDVSYNCATKLRTGATSLTADIRLPRGWIQPSELYKHYNDARLKMVISRVLNTNGCYTDSKGTRYLKVRSIVESSIVRPEYVYTLGIDKDHSYNVEGLIAENCFLLTIGDSLESILKHGIYRSGMISKSSGGLGIDISNVRHSEIKETGWSNGIVPMLQLYNDLVRYVNQKGKRKGACTMSLRTHHIDVEDFIDLPRKVGDRYTRAHDLHISLWTSWLFWERVRTNGKWTLFCPAKVPQLNNLYGEKFAKAYIEAENDPSIAPHHKKVISAQGLYDKIVDVQREAGMPYIMNGDAANMKSNHRHMGYIRASNLCVAGETPILTKQGYFKIESLENKEVEVWNGTEWSTVTVKQTAPCRHLITVILSNGRSLTCTPDHRFIIGDGELVKAKRVCAQFLVPGIKLRQESFPIVDGIESFNYPFLHGVMCAFGCFTEKGPIIDIMGPALSDIMNHPDMCLNKDGAKILPNDLPAPYFVPINSSIKTKLLWLSGFLSARSFTSDNGIIIVSINNKLIQDIQLLLTTLGTNGYVVQSDIYQVPIPDSEQASDRTVSLCNYTLLISWGELAKLCNLGLTSRYSEIDMPKQDKTFDLMVQAVVDIGRLSPTYCFTESKNHAGVFNGILTGQCQEIIEYTDENTIAVCNLHSLSLRMFGKGPISEVYSTLTPESKHNYSESEFAENIRKVVDFGQLSYISRRVVENLNKVIDHNWYPLDVVKDGVIKPKIINKSNKRDRPIGMGVSGFAELLYMLDLSFDNPTVNVLNKMIFACMYWNALAQSVQLAIKEAPYDTFNGSPTSEGLLQFDLWKEEFKFLGPNAARKEEDDEPMQPNLWRQTVFLLYDKEGKLLDIILPTWEDLKRCIVKYGLRNSLFLALMPTASTAQIRRNCETVEQHQNNMYSRKVLKCSYPVLNRYCVSDLESVGAWNDATVEYIRVKNGSVSGIGTYIIGNSSLFPDFDGNMKRILHIERKYKTMWEISQKIFLKLAAERGRYIDQSASSNIFIKGGDGKKLGASHLYANMLGLKTIMYYYRTTGGETIKFTADPKMMQHIKGIIVEDVTKEEENEKKKIAQIVPQVVEASEREVKCTEDICFSCV